MANGRSLPRILAGSLDKGPQRPPRPARPCSRSTRGLVFWGRGARSRPAVPTGTTGRWARGTASGRPTETSDERPGQGCAAVAVSEKRPTRKEGPAGRDQDRGAAPPARGGAAARAEGGGTQPCPAARRPLRPPPPRRAHPERREVARGCERRPGGSERAPGEGGLRHTGAPAPTAAEASGSCRGLGPGRPLQRQQRTAVGSAGLLA